MVLGPAHVGDRFVDIVEEDLREAGAALGMIGAEVGEPAVVSPQSGEAQLEIVGRRRGRDDLAGGEERRHRVREDDLGDDAVLAEIAQPALVVPVAGPTVVLQIAERVLVAAPPRVELVVVLGFEALAVLLMVAARVTVGRDDRVAISSGW